MKLGLRRLLAPLSAGCSRCTSPIPCLACIMKRHPGLQGLSREHHHALVLVRTLRKHATSTLGVETNAVEIGAVRAQWRADIEPHFAVEERELVPLSYGLGAPLRADVETILADHAALRAMVDGLLPEDFIAQAEALAARLETHVRFEEQHWFPHLEAALDAHTLSELSWRLALEPCVPIVGFAGDHEEGPGAWIARLACGHTQHIRHKPPFQNAEWVMSESGRQTMLGSSLKCALCRMPRLPPKACVYKETAVFDENTVPQGLRLSHQLRADTWGQIVVLEGRIDYVIEAAPHLAFVLRPGVMGAVAPQSPHHVNPQPGAKFQVRFLRV